MSGKLQSIAAVFFLAFFAPLVAAQAPIPTVTATWDFGTGIAYVDSGNGSYTLPSNKWIAKGVTLLVIPVVKSECATIPAGVNTTTMKFTGTAFVPAGTYDCWAVLTVTDPDGRERYFPSTKQRGKVK